MRKERAGSSAGPGREATAGGAVGALRAERGLVRNLSTGAGLPGFQLRKASGCRRRLPAGPPTAGGEVMIGSWHCLVGPRDGSLSEEPEEVGVGRPGEGIGSWVNKLGPHRGSTSCW